MLGYVENTSLFIGASKLQVTLSIRDAHCVPQSCTDGSQSQKKKKKKKKSGF